MKVVFTDRARQQFERRLAYSFDRFGRRVAERTFAHVDRFIHNSIARHPDTSGNRHPVRDFYEAWVPRTPFFIIYRIDHVAEVVTVLAIYHHAQDRTTIDPD